MEEMGEGEMEIVGVEMLCMLGDFIIFILRVKE